MNPFAHLLASLYTASREEPAVAALFYLCPFWRDAWTSSPTAYVNVVQPVLDRVNALDGSPLKHEMATFLHGRMNTGVGVSYTP